MIFPLDTPDLVLSVVVRSWQDSEYDD